MLITTMIMAELIHNITELTLVWNCIHMYMNTICRNAFAERRIRLNRNFNANSYC